MLRSIYSENQTFYVKESTTDKDVFNLYTAKKGSKIIAYINKATRDIHFACYLYMSKFQFRELVKLIAIIQDEKENERIENLQVPLFKDTI